MSGFVLTRSYSDKLAGGLSPLQFMIARFNRLYPLYITGLILGIMLYAYSLRVGTELMSSIPAATVSAIFNAMMLPSPLPLENFFPFNPPGWSLFCEMCISGVFCLFLFQRSARTLLLISCVAAALLVMAILKADWLGGWNWSNFHIGILRVVFSFSFGSYVAKTAKPRIRSAASIGLCAALILVFYMPHGTESTVILSIPSIVIACPLILWLAVRYEVPVSFDRLSKALGDISFPLYAIHLPLIPIAVKVASLSPYSHPAVRMAIVTALLVAAAYVVNLVLMGALARVRIFDAKQAQAQ
ncbi:acyltransferase [Sinorhizobium meliloti]|uniref:acyltransferase family protein n=1 Tax=Rhizobium meliloti TaxID=382 RepID=UPI000B499117|nr:acyltransferase [Sinorhizobium meliloti]ASP83583.1 acyltransferase [Sinorhizobium meliloti]MQW26467.1 acyltransferase family protein [Sinorhizobium meliloti]